MDPGTLPIVFSSLFLGGAWGFGLLALLLLTLAHVGVSYPLHLITRKTLVDGSNLSFVPMANALQLVRLSRGRMDSQDIEVVIVTSSLGALPMLAFGSAQGGLAWWLFFFVIFPVLPLALLILISLVHMCLYGPVWLAVARRHGQPEWLGWASMIPLLGVIPQWAIALRLKRASAGSE